jgi:Uncharacterized protein conserved in bacteria
MNTGEICCIVQWSTTVGL